MANSGKTAQWPETIPRHLLRLLRPVRHDEKALKEVLSDRRSLRSSKKNGKAYEFVLKSTNEKLDVHDYPLFKVLYPKTRPRWAIQSLDCILVAKGGCLPESIILGRNKDLPHMELRMWKGKENYEDAVEVEKRYESEEEDDLQSYEDSNERAAKSAVNYIVGSIDNPDDRDYSPEANEDDAVLLSEIINSNAQSDNRLPDQIISRKRRADNADTAGMQQTPATKKFATTTNQTYQSSNRLEQATVKPEQPDGDATSPIDLTKAEEASDTIEVIIPVSAQSTTPKTEPRQESLFSPDRAVFNFRDKNGKVVRQRNLLQCETVGRLWMHATAARVIDTKQRDSLLSAVVNGGEEILLVQGDEGDFEALVEAIKRVACWTAGGVGAECKIDICAA